MKRIADRLIIIVLVLAIAMANPVDDRFLLIILCVFGNYRVARLFTRDTAPYDLTGKLRRALGKFAGMRHEKPLGGTAHTLAELFHCPHCLGMYTAVLFAFYIGGDGVQILITWLAVSGGQSWLQSTIDEGKK